MTSYALNDFVQAIAHDHAESAPFELENPYMLAVNLQGRVWTKVGAMVGYRGNVTFTREGVFEHGVTTLVKRMVSGEGPPLMKVDGLGHVYLADKGKKIHLLQLQSDTMVVNGNDLLAMQDTVAWDITMMRRVAGMVAGGLFNIRLSGHGFIAITTHYDPLMVRVTPQHPLFTDPNATVAWSGT